MRAGAQPDLVHGDHSLCVLKYSAFFAAEQPQSLTTTLSKVLQQLRRLARDLAKPGGRLTERHVRTRIARWLSPAGSLLQAEPPESSRPIPTAPPTAPSPREGRSW